MGAGVAIRAARVQSLRVPKSFVRSEAGRETAGRQMSEASVVTAVSRERHSVSRGTYVATMLSAIRTHTQHVSKETQVRRRVTSKYYDPNPSRGSQTMVPLGKTTLRTSSEKHRDNSRRGEEGPTK